MFISLIIFGCITGLLLISIFMVLTKSTYKPRLFLIWSLLIILQLVIHALFQINPRTITPIGLLLTESLLGPILYLYLRDMYKGWGRFLFIHLIIPAGLVILSFYNLYVREEQKIEISIISTSLGNVFNLIYALACLSFVPFIKTIPSRRVKITFASFVLVGIIVIIVDSLVSISSILYFTNDQELANLSVILPKEYYSLTYYILLTLMAIAASIYSYNRRKIYP